MRGERFGRRWAYGYRGTIGLVKPTYRPGSLEETIRLLPEGVGVIPMHAGIRVGTSEEFAGILDEVSARIEDLASLEVDAIYVEGAPPPMMLGYDADERLSERLTKSYGIPVAFATQALTRALRALEIQDLVGLTYTPPHQNEIFAKYLTDAGFNVEAIQGIDSPFEHADRITPEMVYAAAKKLYEKHPTVDGIYLFGGAWRGMPAIERLEEDLGVPVVGGIQASIWYIMKLLGIQDNVVKGGKLLNDYSNRIALD